MRTTLRTHPKTARTALAAFAAVSTLGLTACSDTAGTEEGADVEDVTSEDTADEPMAEDEAAAEDGGPFEGVYNSAFYDERESYVGEEVVLSADVNEVLSPTAFTIAGTDDTTVEALLVVGATETDELAPEVTVEVTGTVMENFAVADVEEQLGVDLDDELFTEWEQENYLMAEGVEVLETVD